jgi:hypothetical protein
MLSLFKAGLVEGINLKLYVGALIKKHGSQNQVQYCIKEETDRK